ncbi:MAG: rhomboid family intramembrane serine protease [Thermoguttaceae bacterium]|nr:rhomboid family intramembrane serine protease [Thermoguttaceae bacterium]MDW8078519.1 rhomboid family intramembrane serine protease [Thermoguttaceae bacterium]
MLLPYHDDNPTERFPWLTVLLIATNVLVHIHMSRLPERERYRLTYQYGFVPIQLTQLYLRRPVVIDGRYLPAELRDELQRQHQRYDTVLTFWRAKGVPGEVVLPPQPAPRVLRSIITSMFLHGSWLHLVGNMWFFWLFGNNVEDRLGPFRFLLFYLLGGIIAALAHYAAYPTSVVPTIGASGAISAALGAYAITWPHARVHCLVYMIVLTTVRIPALLFIGLWFLGQLLGVLGSGNEVGSGIAWWAHIGGFLAGIGMMIWLAPRERTSE